MTTVAEFTEKAASSFLQSAVFIDDEIFSRPPEQTVLSTDTVPIGLHPKKPIIAPPEDGPGPAPAPQPTTPMPLPPPAFHPKSIVASFAQKGIVCALYEPQTNFATDEQSEVFKLCQAADLIILDWDFQKDEGAKMRELVAALVVQSKNTIPHHSRLLVIYTTTRSLAQVSSIISDRLTKAGVAAEPDRSGLRLDADATRIVVLGKSNVTRLEEEQGFTLAESDLATRVFQEFVAKNEGIMPSFALSGMAAIRRNSRRILAKFNADMDGAFLLHRALVLHNEDAFKSLPSLLAEEFLAVIEDQYAKFSTLDTVASDKVTSLAVGQPQVPWNFDNGINASGTKLTRPATPEEFQNIVKALLNEGVKGLKAHNTCLEVKKLSSNAKHFDRSPDQSALGALRCAVAPAGSHANERLAALFNSRTYYDQQARFLTLGTILRSGNPPGQQYSLCLVPVCDAVRLTFPNQYQFPLLILAHGSLGARGGSGCVVEDYSENLIELVASAKIRDLRIELFAPKQNEGVILADHDKTGYYVTSTSGTRYEWVGQLKPAHAQRAAHGIAQALSRVGLSEAEWVRMLCDR